jgi:hypothetical protein
VVVLRQQQLLLRLHSLDTAEVPPARDNSSGANVMAFQKQCPKSGKNVANLSFQNVIKT